MNIGNPLKKNKKTNLVKKADQAGRAWATLILVFFLLVIAFGAHGAHVFFTVEEGETTGVMRADITSTIIDQEQLDETIEFYENKEDRYQEYINEQPDIPQI